MFVGVCCFCFGVRNVLVAGCCVLRVGGCLLVVVCCFVFADCCLLCGLYVFVVLGIVGSARHCLPVGCVFLLVLVLFCVLLVVRCGLNVVSCLLRVRLLMFVAGCRLYVV